jgi:RNA polymerase sigma-70 factor (ECF subfamily)
VSVHAHARRVADQVAYGPAHAEDNELVRRAQAGDRDAFGKLYVRHAGNVRALIGATVPDRAAAEDIASETWVAAWKNVPRFQVDPDGRFGAWVAGIAKHRVAQAARTAARHPQLPLLDHAGAGGLSPEDVAIARTEMARVKTVLDRLTQVERAAIVFQVTNALTDAEIAQRIGATPRQVERARGHARECLRAARDETPPPRPYRTKPRPPEQHPQFEEARQCLLAAELNQSQAAAYLQVPRQTLIDALNRVQGRQPRRRAQPPAQPTRRQPYLTEHPDYAGARDRVLAGELSKKAAARALGVPRSTFRLALARESRAAQPHAGQRVSRELER